MYSGGLGVTQYAMYGRHKLHKAYGLREISQTACLQSLLLISRHGMSRDSYDWDPLSASITFQAAGYFQTVNAR